MCRWGCGTTDTTYMCKWCGTRFCKECLRGDFGTGLMKGSNWCFQCNQKRCVGKRVEYVPSATTKSEKSARSRSRPSTRSAKSAKPPTSKSKNKAKKKRRK